jgi:hypothetical protein
MKFITQGIGTPSDVAHFVLLGLSPTGPVSITNLDVGVTTVAFIGAERSVMGISAVRTNAGLTPIRTTLSLED